MELWDAYTREGVRTGDVLVRGEEIPAGLYHMVCEVLVQHRNGKFLAMRRASSKQAFPGFLETTAGGSALRGEDKLQCIQRELLEETGIACDAFSQIGCTVSDAENSIFYSFLCTVDSPEDSVCLQEGETEGYLWMTREAFLSFIRSDEAIPTQKKRLLPFVIQLEREQTVR